LNLAADRFKGVNGTKYVVLSTDMDNNSSIDRVLPDLSGIHVLGFLYCTSAVACQRTKDAWAGVLHQAHVASIDWFDPEQAQSVPNPWS
jgi:hypothetical protein